MFLGVGGLLHLGLHLYLVFLGCFTDLWRRRRRGREGREKEGGRERNIEPKQPRLHHYMGQKLLTKWQRADFLWLLMLHKRSHATKFLHCITFCPFYRGHPLVFLILTRRMQLSNGIIWAQALYTCNIIACTL